MIILGIETATQQVGCAIGGVEGLLASFHAARGRRHAETLVPAIEFVCRTARIELREVSVVAADIGPGLFTGLRVGIATAKSLAQALRVPVIGFSSLDLLAHQVRHSSRLIVPVVDARRGEVFSAFYRHVPGGVQRLSEPRVGTADELANDLLARREEALLVGDGALRYAGVLSDDLGFVELGTVGTQWPSATDLVELAHPRALREEFVQPWELAPMYLRKADAEINWATRESA
ncbi:MAG TPA: tRNA (adenosine(37)-N6)-threonylcarbamoyltransferase complex dimerization subunit type 1 TsaB [Acidimicrobiales bacterium]|nr:tRNA (adenosine(37)-N6)-threonylcarbamoyltransferase complex dimerization subunit type 1 TsaB [Acidimicrobiales bacterium]